MSKSTKNSETTIPLSHSDFHILLALANTQLHGYAIMQQVTEWTGGSIRMGPGTLYGAIKRMLSSGLVEEVPEGERPEDASERRRYYRLTNHGDKIVLAETNRLASLVKVAQSKKLPVTVQFVEGAI